MEQFYAWNISSKKRKWTEKPLKPRQRPVESDSRLHRHQSLFLSAPRHKKIETSFFSEIVTAGHTDVFHSVPP